MNLVLFLLKNSRKTFLFAITCSAFSGASNAGIIATINYSLAAFPHFPAWLPGLFVLLCIAFARFQATTLILVTRLSQRIIFTLRCQMAETVLASPLQQIEIIGQSKIFVSLTEDITAIAQASKRLSLIVVSVGTIVGIFIYFLFLSPTLFFGLLGLAIALYSFYDAMVSKGYKSFETARQKQELLYDRFRTLTSGIKELKLNRAKREAFFQEDLQPSAAAVSTYTNQAMKRLAVGDSFGLVAFFFPIGLLLFILPQFVEISAAAIASYTLAILYLIFPFVEIIDALPEVAQANVALRKLESLQQKLSKAIAEPKNSASITDRSPSWTSLAFIDIHYAYVGEAEIHQFKLSNITLTFYPGELVFIVGGNGSGKSTFIKLLTGLYAPTQGKIFWDGQLITDENRDWYRQHFATVFADFHLFDRLSGVAEYQQADIHTYLSRLELTRKVTVQEDGSFSTTNLSQGQRKRLALLTAYLEDRPIYVFDEWASDQDPVYRAIFYENLLPELKQRGKTVIAVTHDDRYFSVADRRIRLDYGRIVNTSTR
ncbi:MAG: cyclic peptide export ABC transporter [Cyanophyceae cyanobacterium]